jgi:hypothetical protein
VRHNVAAAQLTGTRSYAVIPASLARMVLVNANAVATRSRPDFLERCLLLENGDYGAESSMVPNLKPADGGY